MPVEQRSGSSQVIAIVIGVVVVVVAVAAAWGFLQLASGGKGPVKVQLGDETFDAGQAVRLARQVAKEGPVLFSDVSGQGQRRPIFVNHFGDDPKAQWYAFAATAPGTDPADGCYLHYDAGRKLFEERKPNTDDLRKPGELCGDAIWSVTGEGLQQYPWHIDSAGNLVIDLRKGSGPTTSTTSTTSGG